MTFTPSGRGFSATTTGSGGTLGDGATVTFASGVATATEYYGDQAAATRTSRPRTVRPLGTSR